MKTLGAEIFTNRIILKKLEEELISSKKEKDRLLMRLLEALLANPKAHKNYDLFSSFLLQLFKNNDRIVLQLKDEKNIFDTPTLEQDITISNLGKSYKPFFKVLEGLGFKFSFEWIQSGPMGDLQYPELKVTVI